MDIAGPDSAQRAIESANISEYTLRLAHRELMLIYYFFHRPTAQSVIFVTKMTLYSRKTLAPRFARFQRGR